MTHNGPSGPKTFLRGISHAYMPCWTTLRHSWGPQKGPFWPRKALLGAPDSSWGQNWSRLPLVSPAGWAVSISCAWTPEETSMALLGPPKGPVLAQKGPFEGSGRPQTVPGSLIRSQVLPFGPTGLGSSSPHTLTWYWALLLQPRAPKGPFLAKKHLFGSIWVVWDLYSIEVPAQ